MTEPPITEAGLERMISGFQLFNRGDSEALEEFFAEEVVMERAGDLPPVQGWPAVRQFFPPNAFQDEHEARQAAGLGQNAAS